MQPYLLATWKNRSRVINILLGQLIRKERCKPSFTSKALSEEPILLVFFSKGSTVDFFLKRGLARPERAGW